MTGHFLAWLVCSVLARRFPSRYRLIPRMPDGAPLLRQFRICSFGKEKPRGVPPWWHFSVYLQSFVNPEVKDEFHVHRWRRMFSFVLSGAFEEERRAYHVRHKSPSFYTMGSEVVHRFSWVAPNTWTLFVMVGRNKNKPAGGWGYYARGSGKYRPWNVAIPVVKRIRAF